MWSQSREDLFPVLVAADNHVLFSADGKEATIEIEADRSDRHAFLSQLVTSEALMQAVHSTAGRTRPGCGQEDSFVGELELRNSAAWGWPLKLLRHNHVSDVVDHDLSVRQSNGHDKSVWVEPDGGNLDCLTAFH